MRVDRRVEDPGEIGDERGEQDEASQVDPGGDDIVGHGVLLLSRRTVRRDEAGDKPHRNLGRCLDIEVYAVITLSTGGRHGQGSLGYGRSAHLIVARTDRETPRRTGGRHRTVTRSVLVGGGSSCRRGALGSTSARRRWARRRCRGARDDEDRKST